MREYGLQVLGISESKWNESGKSWLSTGETVLFSGKDNNIHEHRVAIMLSKEAERSMISWALINEHIIKAWFYSKHIKLTLIHVYAPTNNGEEEAKEFYEKFQATIDEAPRHHMLIITGDMDAKWVAIQRTMKWYWVSMELETGMIMVSCSVIFFFFLWHE